MGEPDPYFLGYRQAEQDRLQRQAQELAADSNWLFDHIGVPAGSRVIEIGCGPQGCLGLLAGRVGATGRVVCVERSAEQVQRARRFVADCRLTNVEVLRADGRKTGLVVTVASRRRMLVLLAGLGVPLASVAQASGTVRRIGYLTGGSGAAVERQRQTEAFNRRLGELGWVEGTNLTIEYRFAEGQIERLPELAAELVRLKVEIIVAVATPAAIAAKKATTTIPIVMASVGDPVGFGLVASLARPGGNVTGLAYGVGRDLFGKQLQLLKDAVPGLKRVAILSNPANQSHAPLVETLKPAAQSLVLSLQFLQARGPDEFKTAFAEMATKRAEAVLVVQDSMFTVHRVQLAELAIRSRLPSMFGLSASVESGGLMSYGSNLTEQLRQASAFVDRILRGARPADMPVEQPTTLELVINLRTAKALGITIPQPLLLRADQLIQ